MDSLGFIGLGNMGRPMSTNVARGGHGMIVFDAAGTAERAPQGARVAQSVAQVAAEAGSVILSLPDGAASQAVAGDIVGALGRRTREVIDTSTIGAEASRKVHAMLGEAGIAYFDAPVSGGTAGAASAGLAVMFAGPAADFDRLRPVLEAMGRNTFHVGTEAGQGQTMKVLNNFLSATAMAATSEAISMGVASGLDMGLMIDVLNASSGQNTATSDKFPNRILPEAYDAGFTNTLLAKDVSLYLESVAHTGTQGEVSGVVVDVWRRFAAAEPGTDFTRIYPFVRDGETAADG